VEHEYFVDGVTDELIGQLAQISGLHRVISRTTMMEYKGVEKPLPEIARELNVDAVVEGTVYQVGEKVRIQVRLIDALPEEQNLWGQTYERAMSDVLVMYSEMARAIANKIQVELTPGDETRFASPRLVKPGAYDAYLKGRYFLEKTELYDDQMRAIQLFEKAIEIDPKFALAYVELANAYGNSVFFSHLTPQETYSKRMAAIMKALELDDSLAEAHAALGFIRFEHDWDWAGAELHFRRALELNSNNVDVLSYYIQYLIVMGQFDEGIVLEKRRRELQPSPPTWDLAWCYMYARRFDESIAEFKKLVEIIPNNHWVFMFLAVNFAERGLYKEALEWIERARPLVPPGQSLQFDFAPAYIYGKAGKTEEAKEILDRYLKKSGEEVVDPGQIAAVYAAIGDKERALNWLEKAFEERSPAMPWLKIDFQFDPLRSEPRFKDLMNRMNFTEN
jgi:TolB-like protein/Tfp pilus assembly protein PilF